MSKPLLDDDSDHWKTIIRPDTINAGIIILIGVFFVCLTISEWYSFHDTSILSWHPEPEIVYPIKLLASLLTCFYGIRLFLEKMKLQTAILLSVLTLVGVNIMALLLW